MMAKDPPETLELQYVDPTGKTVSHASGVVVTRVSSGLYQLAFYTDVSSLETESLRLESTTSGGAVYKNIGGPPTARPYREIQARVLMTHETLRQLSDVITKQIDPAAAE